MVVSMLEQLVSVFTVAAIALAAYGLGRPLLRGLRVGAEDPWSIGMWSVSLGLIAAGALLAGLGMVGLLYAPLIGALSAAACFWGLGELLNEYIHRQERNLLPVVRQPIPLESPGPLPFAPPSRWLAVWFAALAGLACCGSLVGALAPPTDGDALCYHLELPKAFLAAGQLEFLPDSDNSTFPLLVEMWYLWALALDGGVAAQLLHWALGLLLALATVSLATSLVGRAWGWIAGAIVLLVPSVTNQMTAPLNDVALALLCTLALAAWWRAAVEDESRRWYVVSGLCAGGALGTKYLALLFFVAMAVTVAWMAWRQRQRRQCLMEGTAVVAIVALSVGGCWYLRAAWHRGNPVHPFFTEVFDDGEADAAAKPALHGSKLPLGRRPHTLLTAAWQVTMRPERYGGRGHQVGALFLAVAPGLFFARRLRGLGVLLSIAGAYWFLWFLLRQNVRFLLPIVPVLSVMALWVLVELGRLPVAPRRIALAALAASLLACSLAALARCGDRVAVACGWESRAEYLTRCEPTWPAAQVSNDLANRSDHILSQEHRAFYFNCRVTRENLYRRRTGYDRQIHDPHQFSRRLREAGFTHLLLAENRSTAGPQYDSTLSRLADAQRAADGGESLTTLTEYEFPDADGGIRRYRLVLLQ